jgi:hypothetical protein
MIGEFQNAFTSLFRVGLVASCALAIVLPEFALAGAATPLGAGSLPAVTSLVTEVKDKGKDKDKNKKVIVKKDVHVKNVYVNKGHGGKNWYVKRWNHKPYYGNVIAGVALGTFIATAAGAAPPPPAANLCWYWTSPARNRGYWDYCY